MSARTKDIPLFETGLESVNSDQMQACDHGGCSDEGLHRAPKSPDQEDGFYWFCRAHARLYNSKWNYFNGWSAAEIDNFRREAVIGHRPTWKMGAHSRPWGQQTVSDPFDILDENSGFKDTKQTRTMPNEQHDALAVLNLDVTASLQEIKMRYKQLVKRFHPDVNGGDKRAEESFKKVNEAYQHLLTCGGY